jgi:signal transduction histidine kinase
VGPLTQEQLRFLDTAERQGMRLLRIIQDLRTVALAEREALELDWATCDLAEVARLAVENVAAVALARRKPIELGAEGETRVLGDQAACCRPSSGYWTTWSKRRRPRSRSR